MIPNDYPSLNFDLGDTVEMIRDSVRAFTSDHIAPRAAEIDETNEFPNELWPKLGELGVLGVTADEEYGGAGLGYLEHCVAMEDPGLAVLPRFRVLLSKCFILEIVRYSARCQKCNTKFADVPKPCYNFPSWIRKNSAFFSREGVLLPVYLLLSCILGVWGNLSTW